ncbi:MAG: NAD(P)H-dependent oxidoreductase subunit E [Thermoanaerobaculia bacterium]|nr:NAD(P)H-dependent oxidoreductase subunit E [Thermoanaerobaculia bacterium]
MEEDDVTPDGRCSFTHFECLGACEQAPMMMVDDVYHGNLDPERVTEILEELE